MHPALIAGAVAALGVAASSLGIQFYNQTQKQTLLNKKHPTVLIIILCVFIVIVLYALKKLIR